MAFAWALVTQLLLLFGWQALQDLGSRALLNFAYKCPVARFRLRCPAEQSGAAMSHWALAHIVVALLFLAYHVGKNAWRVAPNVYTMLGLGPGADVNEIKRSFRSYAKLHHPDKVGVEAESNFMLVHQGYAALTDPVLRYAYDRFGKDVFDWRTCSSVRDFMRTGMQALVQTHVFLLVAHVISYATSGRSARRSIGLGTFWGLVLQCAMLAVQVNLVLQADRPPWLHLLGRITQYELIDALTREFTTTLLSMEACASWLALLFKLGSLDHFRFGEGPPPPDDRDAVSSAEVMSIVRQEPKTLEDAKKQLELLSTGILQLEDRAVQVGQRVFGVGGPDPDEAPAAAAPPEAQLPRRVAPRSFPITK